jgi:hypothetical protein
VLSFDTAGTREARACKYYMRLQNRLFFDSVRQYSKEVQEQCSYV